MKLIIDIPEEVYRASRIIDVKYEDVIQIPLEVLANGTPLDDVINKIDKAYDDLDGYDPYALGTFANKISDILDNIGKESEDKNDTNK